MSNRCQIIKNATSQIWIILFLVAISACSQTDQDEPGKAESSLEEASTFWQLTDDSNFTASVEPWPVVMGDVDVNVTISMNDYDQTFSGSVSCRFRNESGDTDSWKKMTSKGEDENGTRRYQTTLFVDDSGNIEFKVNSDYWGEVELTDWKISVK